MARFWRLFGAPRAIIFVNRKAQPVRATGKIGQVLIWLTCLLLVGGVTAETTSPGLDSWQLSEHCPPGFRLEATGTCALISLYLDYQSQQSIGVGGLRTGLPPHRGGFTPKQIDLGRLLFFDPILSSDNTIACASCHHPDQGFGDGRAQSIGIDGHKTRRSAPTLWNVGFQSVFFWDARAETLEEQMTGPLYSSEEMGNTPAQLLDSLNAVPAYRLLFEQAFPTPKENTRIQLEQIYTALAAFEASLVSLNSRYDHYAHGFHDALTQEEIDGLNVFRSFVARCAECHTPPLFTNQQIAVTGVPELAGEPLDPGAAGVTGEASQTGAFKVPTLRNIALTSPYMHSGSMETLFEATEFYNLGRGHAAPPEVARYVHWHIWEPGLTQAELKLLVKFMLALTDESYKPRIPSQVPSGLPVTWHIKNL